MSKYTTELRFICEQKSGLNESVGYNDVETVIANSREKIFNFNYPIFDDNYKSVLETKIIKHYYTREICAETVGLWQLWLNSKMNEIMPYYNKLYESELLKFDPLRDYFLEKTGGKKGEENQTNSGSDEINNTLSGSDKITSIDSGNESVVSVDSGSENVSMENSGSDVEEENNRYSGTSNTEYGGADTMHTEDAPIKDTWDLYSDTPQGDIIGMENDNNRYLTNARHITESGAGSEKDETKNYGQTNENTTSGTESIEKTNTYGKVTDTETTFGKQNDIETTFGKQNDTETKYGKKSNQKTDYGKIVDLSTTEEYFENISGKVSAISYSKLLQDFRDTFLNIDVMIIKELSDLFFNLW